ncbi:sulfhydryl oxidase 1-like isoform X1 [Dermacentor andersoni]|uniref:sulfhydryl oxidase 1-like isoform X1 n=2 Tax=Dermacentor andersoni TaxID=34620 RepID=UPI00215598A4|nr:sulfhydryl oxidase 1-like isoform X1 [Dermacentor andersoni]
MGMSGSIMLLFLLGAGILLLGSVNSTLGSASLYDPSMPLQVLNTLTFHKVILNKENAWLVQFYNHWCGHCIKFSPIFKAFANDIAGWKAVISLAVVDCVDNMQLCRTYGINSYPTIKFFRARSTFQDRGVEVETHRYPEQLRHQAIDLVDSKDAYRGRWPASWPSFDAFQGERTTEGLWEYVPENVDVQILVVECNTSYIGREVTLDLSSRKSIHVQRLVVSSDRTWLSSLLPNETNVSGVRWADLYVLHRNGTSTRLLRVKEEDGSRENVLRVLEPYMRAISSSTATTASTASPEESKVVDMSKVYLADLNNALVYSLRQEVAGHEHLNRTELAALVHFVDVLVKYFPGGDPTKVALQNLHTFVASAGTDSLRGEQLSAFLDKQVGLPVMGPYEGCLGSQPRLRGYPCALWMLFHSLTVSAYLKSGGYPLGRDASGADVLQAVRGYVTYFFSCRYCAVHFSTMAKNLDSEVQTSQDAVLWLWRVHNKVNARLAGDMSEDPMHPKQPFPPPTLCSDCHEGTRWNEQHSLSFLLHFYAPDGLVPVGNPDGQDHAWLTAQSGGTRARWSSLFLLAAVISAF